MDADPWDVIRRKGGRRLGTLQTPAAIEPPRSGRSPGPPIQATVPYDVDTRPGAWVARQAARKARLFWLGGVAALALVGGVVALSVGHRVGIGAAVLLFGLVAAAKPRAESAAAEMLNWLRGARAEEAVGETLNELRSEGWIVMHDIEQSGEGNVDHLVSGPNGVYLIETKLRRYQAAHLTKAKRQAAKLKTELGVWVTPVICLDQRRGRPFRIEGVWIVPREQLLDWLRAPAQPARPVRAARPLRRQRHRIRLAGLTGGTHDAWGWLTASPRWPAAAAPPTGTPRSRRR